MELHNLLILNWLYNGTRIYYCRKIDRKKWHIGIGTYICKVRPGTIKYFLSLEFLEQYKVTRLINMYTHPWGSPEDMLCDITVF